MKVPFFRSPWQFDHLCSDASARMAEVLASGAYILNREVSAFEAEFSAWLGDRPVVGVNSGTDAVVLALQVLGVGPGDEVILSTYTFFACYEAVVRTGATPVLVDTAPHGYLPNPGQIAAKIGPRTRAILAVPLFGETHGLSALYELCVQHNLFLVEDVAQACGGIVVNPSGPSVRAGMLGHASAFSFFPTKNLGAAGDAGAVSFRDPQMAEQCRAMRNHAYINGHHTEIGLNSRLDELQAALLRVGLRKLDAQLARRREIAECYLQAWAEQPHLALPPATEGHAWNYFVVCHPQRDQLQQLLTESGVETRVYYTQPIHLQPAYRAHNSALHLPGSERLARHTLALPIYPDMTDEQVAIVIEAMTTACTRIGVSPYASVP